MSTGVRMDGSSNTGYGTSLGEPTSTSNITVCWFFKYEGASGSGFGCQWMLSPTISTYGHEIFTDSTPTMNYATGLANTTVITTAAFHTDTWYFCAFTASGVNAALYIKPVGAPTCLVTKTGSALTFTPADMSFGNEFVQTGSQGVGVLGSQAGFKLWSGVVLTQAEIEMESEHLMPVRTADLFSYWPLAINTDLRDDTQRAVLLVAPAPATLSQSSGPGVQEDILSSLKQAVSRVRNA